VNERMSDDPSFTNYVDESRRVADLKELTRDEWLRARRAGIGASEAAAIVGQSPWSSPYQVWLDKTGQVPVSGEETEAMYFGTLLEDTIAKATAERTGWHITDPKATYAHPEHKWMLASPDRIIKFDGGDGLLEIKNSGGYKLDEWKSGAPDEDGRWVGGEAPLHYILQVQHQHAVMGTYFGYIAALLGGNRLCIVQVDRDDELIEMLISKEKAFWVSHVEGNTAPPLDGMQSTSDALAQIFSESDPSKTVELDETIARAILDYADASSAEAKAKEAKTLAGNILRDALGDAEQATYQGVPVASWKGQATDRFDQTAFKAEYPEIYNKFVKVTHARVLRPAKSKAAQEALALIKESN
jgi:putative phage-type endonuclease